MFYFFKVFFVRALFVFSIFVLILETPLLALGAVVRGTDAIVVDADWRLQVIKLSNPQAEASAKSDTYTAFNAEESSSGELRLLGQSAQGLQEINLASTLAPSGVPSSNTASSTSSDSSSSTPVIIGLSVVGGLLVVGGVVGFIVYQLRKTTETIAGAANNPSLGANVQAVGHVICTVVTNQNPKN